MFYNSYDLPAFPPFSGPVLLIALCLQVFHFHMFLCFKSPLTISVQMVICVHRCLDNLQGHSMLLHGDHVVPLKSR